MDPAHNRVAAIKRVHVRQKIPALVLGFQIHSLALHSPRCNRTIDAPSITHVRFSVLVKEKRRLTMMGFLRGLGQVRRWSAAMAVIAATVLAAVAYAGAPAGDIPSGSLVQPHELAQTLKSGEKPVVLYVGPKQFYVQAHIPGAEDMGAVGQPEGMAKLRARAARLPKDGPVVVYCGCCPWDRCPNIRPAFAELKKLGFSKVRVLYIEKGFGVDWAEKGFPVAKGE